MIILIELINSSTPIFELQLRVSLIIKYMTADIIKSLRDDTLQQPSAPLL